MNPERLLMVLKRPHISEKATVMAEHFNQYTFQVLKSATKLEIKHAVEQLYGVKVESVSTVNVKGKKKQFKQILGKRNDWKKAYVSLQENNAINFGVSE